MLWFLHCAPTWSLHDCKLWNMKNRQIEKARPFPNPIPFSTASSPSFLRSPWCPAFPSVFLNSHFRHDVISVCHRIRILIRSFPISVISPPLAPFHLRVLRHIFSACPPLDSAITLVLMWILTRWLLHAAISTSWSSKQTWCFLTWRHSLRQKRKVSVCEREGNGGEL